MFKKSVFGLFLTFRNIFVYNIFSYLVKKKRLYTKIFLNIRNTPKHIVMKPITINTVKFQKIIFKILICRASRMLTSLQGFYIHLHPSHP